MKGIGYCLLGAMMFSLHVAGQNHFPSSGNVGIGAGSSPAHPLHIINSGSAPAIKIEGSSGFAPGIFWDNTTAVNGRRYSLYSSSDGNFLIGDETAAKVRLGFWTNGSAAFNGDLAVGYVDGNEVPGSRVFSVNGGINARTQVFTYNGTSAGGLTHYLLSSPTSGHRFGIGLQGEESSGNAGSDFKIWRYDNTAGYLGMAFGIKRQNGFIGINTSDPLFQLHITGEDAFQAKIQSSNNEFSGFYMKGGPASTAQVGIHYGSNSGLDNTIRFGRYDLNANTIGSGWQANPVIFDLDAPDASLYVSGSGRVGIGTFSVSDVNYRLFVEGGIRARKVKVDMISWPDYVFDSTYRLRPIKEVEAFIQQYRHLPDVSPAAAIESEGLDLGSNQSVLLKKIEELTLYLIDQQKQIELLQKENKNINGQLKLLLDHKAN